MSKAKEREDALASLTARIFAAMLDDIVMDTMLQSHREAARSRVPCHVCNRQCGLDHSPSASASSQAPSLPTASSSPILAAAELKVANGSSGTGASTPSSVKADGNIYFECLNCQRQIASTRYAPHLSSCMGIGTGTRRGAIRAANSTKQSSPAAPSLSPSDAGNLSDDSASGREKSGTSKSKREDDAEFNLKRKRASPQLSQSKKTKQQKASGSAVDRIKADPDAGSTISNTSLVPLSKMPSKLRESSTIASNSPASRSRSSSESFIATPSSSGGAAAVAAPSVPATTPTPKPKGRPRKKTNTNGNTEPPPIPSPVKQPSPPRVTPPPVRVMQPEYPIDVGGEETGSSTDTDNEQGS